MPELLKGIENAMARVGETATPPATLTVLTPGIDEALNPLLVEIGRASSVKISRLSASEFLLTIGHHDGSVSLRRLSKELDVVEVRTLWTREGVHDGSVSSVGFLGEMQVVNGGMDKKVCMFPIDHSDNSEIRQMRLSIDCRGVMYTGAKRDQERDRLAELSSNS